MGRIPEGTASEGGYKSPSIQHLWPHHRSMARMFVEGAQPSDIATITGFSLGQISRILGSPAFQIELNRLAEAADANAVDVNQLLADHAPRAAAVLIEDTYQEVEDNDKARASRQTAAKDILDRTGHHKGVEPLKPGGDLNVTQINIGKLSTSDLFTQVMDVMNQAELEGGTG